MSSKQKSLWRIDEKQEPTKGVRRGSQGIMATPLPPEAACEKTHNEVLQDVLLAHALEAPHSHSSA